MADIGGPLPMTKVDEVVHIINTEFGFNYTQIKPEQLLVISNIVNKKDTVAVLPCGFGKTFCFTAPVLVLDKIEPGIRHVAIVVSPLVALMRDHVKWLGDHGIKATSLTSNMTKEDVKDYGQTKPRPRDSKGDYIEHTEHKCLFRATNGKKKLSTVISVKDVTKFQMAYANVLKANMDSLKKRDKRSAKSKSKTTKAT